MTDERADEIVRLLGEILAELRAQRRPPSKDEAAREWMADLLLAIRAPRFTMKGLIERSATDDKLRELVGAYSPKALQWRVRGFVGKSIEGKTLVRVGQDRGAFTYAVRDSRDTEEQFITAAVAGFLRVTRGRACPDREA